MIHEFNQTIWFVPNIRFEKQQQLVHIYIYTSPVPPLSPSHPLIHGILYNPLSANAKLPKIVFNNVVTPASTTFNTT
jgi:hypothetical protein